MAAGAGLGDGTHTNGRLGVATEGGHERHVDERVGPEADRT